ncbi:hypothetical protein [Diaminobutyricibacter sp. McL0608]|uniref:hypothetical protein n=1 Tax=Leifsonia sp. McL0608 TaxID=3143537 RepID=UPI0031F2DC21
MLRDIEMDRALGNHVQIDDIDAEPVAAEQCHLLDINSQVLEGFRVTSNDKGWAFIRSLRTRHDGEDPSVIAAYNAENPDFSGVSFAGFAFESWGTWTRTKNN